MKRSYKTALAVVLCILICASLSGCGKVQEVITGIEQNWVCTHEWEKATCLVPRTCKLCGLSEGKIRSHEWENTACNVKAGCIFCGTTEGMELTHTWRTDGMICRYCGLDERPADIRFIEQLVEGLERRWARMRLAEMKMKYPDMSHAETAEQMSDFLHAEYDLLAEFRDDVFENEDLGYWAYVYIDSLAAGIEALSVFGTDEWESKYPNDAYQQQIRALFEINTIQPLEVMESEQNSLTFMLYNGGIIVESYKLIDQVLFLDISTAENLKRFETTVTNTTELTYKWFLFRIDLLDSDGNLVGTETAKVYNWAPGARVRFNFYTTTKFAEMEVSIANWELDALPPY